MSYPQDIPPPAAMELAKKISAMCRVEHSSTIEGVARLIWDAVKPILIAANPRLKSGHAPSCQYEPGSSVWKKCDCGFDDFVKLMQSWLRRVLSQTPSTPLSPTSPSDTKKS